MGNSLFNYGKFHFFDNNGHELLLKKKYSLGFTIPNEKYPDSYSKYAFISTHPEIPDTSTGFAESLVMEEISIGERYNIPFDSSTISVTTFLPDGTVHEDRKVSNISPQYRPLTIKSYTSSGGIQYRPDINFNSLSTAQRYIFLGHPTWSSKNLSYDWTKDYIFPSYTFSGVMNFEKVSTDLVETQRLYILVDNPFSANENNISQYTTVKELADASTDPYSIDTSTYIDRYKLFFFIDQREQQDFRFFNLENDNLVWSDRCFVDFKQGTTDSSIGNGYSVNIGFRGDKEGLYEQPLYVCILDTSTANENTNYQGDIYPIGEIKMIAETEGEDERYRTLFTNFGIPDPITFDEIFKDSIKRSDSIDNISLNKHSKEMFLTYNEIFPYVGTYKALFNSMKLFGYDDVFFKEWYKEIGKTNISDGGYVAFDMSYKADPNARTIMNIPIEERIHLKKLNWLSMMYKLNDKTDEPEDIFGFPTTINNNSYHTPDNVVKLIYLKKWLEKYVIGVNCRITDVGGEGIVFERYALPKFGKYQKVFEYSNEKSISPVVRNDTEVIQDGSANIIIDIYNTELGLTIEDCNGESFIDYCTGYLNHDDFSYHNIDSDIIDTSTYIYCGKTFEMDDNTTSFELRTKGVHNTFRFNENYIDSCYPTLILDNDELFLDPHYMENIDSPYNAPFSNLPIIKIERGYIKRYKDNTEHLGIPVYDAYISKDTESDNGISYIIDVSTGSTRTTITTQDIITLVPPVFDVSLGELHITPHSSGNYRITRNDLCAYDYNFCDINTYVYYNAPSKKTRNCGLRFTTNTPDGLGTFKIIGYEEPSISDSVLFNTKFPELQKLIPPKPTISGYEYYLEILDGQMIFNDKENNRKVSLNFSYNEEEKHVSVNVTTFTYSSQDTTYKYISDSSLSYIDQFIDGNLYEAFVEYYDSSIDEAIIHTTEKKINVINTGEYEIDAIIYDEYNNIFANKANKTVSVLTPNIDITTYINDETSNNDYNIYGGVDSSGVDIINNDSSVNCSFKYIPKVQIYNVDRDNLIIDISSDFHTVRFPNKQEVSHIQISTLSEKFDFAEITRKNDSSFYYSFIKKKFINSDYSNRGYVYADGQYDLERICIDASYDFTNFVTPTNLLDVLDNADNTPELEMGILKASSCYMIAYSPSSESIIFCVPGEAIPTLFTYNPLPIQNYNINEYRFKPYSIKDSSITEIMNTVITQGCCECEFYLIPTWLFNIYYYSTDSSNDILTIKTRNYPFGRVISDNNLIKILFSGNYVKVRSRNVFGQSSYTKVNTLYETIDTSLPNVSHILKGNMDSTYTTSGTVSGNLNLSFGHGCCEYMNFSKDIPSILDIRNSKIYLPNTQENVEFMKYIDTTYAVSVRNFNVFDAKNIWDNSTTYNSSTLRSYNVPVTITDDSESKSIVITANMSRAFPQYTNHILESIKDIGGTACWKIYNRNGKSNSKLMFEVYNNMLPLSIKNKGIYDVELNIYDNNGNKYNKTIKGLITYK